MLTGVSVLTVPLSPCPSGMASQRTTRESPDRPVHGGLRYLRGSSTGYDKLLRLLAEITGCAHTRPIGDELVKGRRDLWLRIPDYVDYQRPPRTKRPSTVDECASSDT